MDFDKEIKESLRLLELLKDSFLAKGYYGRAKGQIELLRISSTRDIMEGVGYIGFGAVAFFWPEITEYLGNDISSLEEVIMRITGSTISLVGSINLKNGITKYSNANKYESEAEKYKPENRV